MAHKLTDEQIAALNNSVRVIRIGEHDPQANFSIVNINGVVEAVVVNGETVYPKTGDPLELAATIGEHLCQQAKDNQAYSSEPHERLDDDEDEPIPNTLIMGYDGTIDLVKLATVLLAARPG